ncbi:thioesterase superfamily protein [Sporocytophaga myxococcoides]|uniref:Thioesterase superfamily protein n=2 Tax=Sporocytophaga myxococcoides TaxID=153721 RepID=A0A098LL14_9BACT|nr:thioesterase superfamily protein [Sporocytophaga myxococcoides]
MVIKTLIKNLKKFASESLVTMTELVLPNDTNPLHNLMGGKMMHWMDIVSAISAQKHSNSVVVTASVDNVSFSSPIKLGNVVTLTAKVTRSFSTSMEVHIEVWAEDIPSGTKIKSNEAFFTFVAMDGNGNPKKVPELVPETEKEKNFYESAMRRRELRLVLAGRLKAQDATELRSLFKE